jgi:hypothetical protein
VAFTIFRPNKKLDNWLNEVPPTKAAHGRFDIILPAPVIGCVALLGIIVVSVAGCFAYYPEPKEALEELRVASIESSAAAISGIQNSAFTGFQCVRAGIRDL